MKKVIAAALVAVVMVVGTAGSALAAKPKSNVGDCGGGSKGKCVQPGN